MAEKISVWAEDAPSPFGHFSQAIKMDDMIYISGQLPLDAKNGKPIGGSVEDQARQVLDNLTAVLQSTGGQMGMVLKTTLYLTDLRDFPTYDKISKDYFFFTPPAQTTIVVSALPGGSKICLDAVAKFSEIDAQGKSMI